MDTGRLAEEYIKRKALLDQNQKDLDTIKDLLVKAIDAEGYTDDKGHKFLDVGEWRLQRQKRQGDKRLNRQKAEEWAKEKGFWDEVTTPVLSEDALLGYVYERRHTDPALSETLKDLYEEAPITWAFMPPTNAPTDY